MTRLIGTVGVAAVLFTFCPLLGYAQQGEALRVFLDCQTFFCDFDHFRREITWVNWVRDRQDAQVHILGTAQGTGGGGREFTFTFIGLRQFAGQSDTLRHISSNTDTQSEIRDGHVRTVKLGLVRYAASTPAVTRLDVTYEAPEEGEMVVPTEDPWKLWTFQIRVGGNLSGEEQQRFESFNGSLLANRTAENIKMNFRISGSFNRSEQELTDETFVNTSRNVTATQSIVWSMNPHWSVGVRSSQIASTFLNQALTVRGGPAIEYNVYPYGESTRRQFRFRYSPEAASFDYEEPTVFDKETEVLPAHRLDASMRVQQPWGSVDLSVGAIQYLHDGARHRININGFVDLRIVRGLSFNIGEGFSRIQDQIYLPKGGLTDEEILVRRRQLGTNFSYFTFMSLSFRFGSSLANVVNPRMQGIDDTGSGGGFCFCF